jgi:hypothetical protein
MDEWAAEQAARPYKNLIRIPTKRSRKYRVFSMTVYQLAPNKSQCPSLPSMEEVPQFYPDRFTERIAEWCQILSDRAVVGIGGC